MSMLRIADVSKSYRRGARDIPVLRDVTLEVAPGELVAVYGQRSAGKTTLLKIAAGFERPDRGQVAFAGRDLARFSRRRMARLHRRDIGWIARSGPHSPELPIRTYVALPLYRDHGPGSAQRRAIEALARAGVEDCAEQRWQDLSDTARSLVAIAQALAREPRLLVADDPTAGLGIVDRERVIGLLREAAEEGGLAVLVAVPDMPALLHAHQVLAISRGRLIAPAGDEPGDGGKVLEFPRGKRTA